MKLHSHKSERRGNDRIKLWATWSDHMIRPASVQITWGHLESPTVEPQLLLDGDVKQSTDVLFAIAEMAWSFGWRPRGLAGTLGGLVQQYKIPQE